MSRSAARWLVAGRVQGVGFRWFVLRKAQELGVVGWVENLPDGGVEVVAHGPNDAIESLDAALRRGPRLAAVSHVERSVCQHEIAGLNSFEIK
jgi:acylphosphatase